MLSGMNTDLDQRVKALLNSHRGDWQAIADGSGVSYSWLSKFVNGHIENPGFATLKKLCAFLEALPVEAARASTSASEAAHPTAQSTIDPYVLSATRRDGPSAEREGR